MPEPSFDVAYGANPWATFQTNQHTVYVPDLLETFRRQAAFYRLVDYKVDLAAQRTGQMVFTQLFDPEPNTAELDQRALWLPQLYVDSRSRTITVAHYGGKVQLRRWDDMITYWRENGKEGMRAILRSRLGPNMIATLDLLARNAFLRCGRYSFAGSATGFATLAKTDVFNPEVCRIQQLSADYAVDPVDNPIFCVTSPAAVYQMRKDGTEFIERVQYADPARLINYEIGMYEGVRFSTASALTLYNCGEIITQKTITAALNPGDGAASSDEGWSVGQPGTAGVHVDTVTNLNVGDIVTLHRVRATASDAPLATTNGPIFDHPYNIVREIVAIDGPHNIVYLNAPVLVDWFSTAISAGVYGYLTKARHIHAAVFVKGPQGVVCGVAQPPQTYEPPAIDDTMSVFRFTWDARLKYQPFYPERVHVYFFAGPVAGRSSLIDL